MSNFVGFFIAQIGKNVHHTMFFCGDITISVKLSNWSKMGENRYENTVFSLIVQQSFFGFFSISILS
jgi:hypothetical protein